MVANRDDQGVIRAYLLGKLNAEDREEFEQQLFADDHLHEELQAAEEDLIDDFLTGDLEPDDIPRFHQNFLVSSKRKQALRLGKAWRSYAATHAGEKPLQEVQTVSGWDWRKIFSLPILKPAAITAAILIAAIVGWRIWSSRSEVDQGLLALNAAYSKERPLESRITRFDYAPFRSTRGPGQRDVNENELARSELLLRDELRRRSTPAAHHALGKVYLAESEFDKAIDEFEKAQKNDLDNAQIYADLGAALLEKGKLEVQAGKTDPGNAESGKGMEYFARSLSNLNKALELDHDLSEALFNRALLDESMGLLPEAEADWHKYLEKDSSSKWADEARQRLAQLEQRLKDTSLSKQQIFEKFLKDYDGGDEDRVWTVLSSYQNRSGNIVSEQLIDNYFEALVKNEKEDAHRALGQLSYLAELQLRKTTDRYLIDLVQVYESAPARQRDLIVNARELMERGYDGWGRISVEENAKLFKDARDLFERAGDYPETAIADYWISFCHYRQHEQEQSRQILDPLLPACENRHYFWLQARLLYLLSAIEFDRNEHTQAVDFGLQAVRVAERLNDSVGLLNATSALIEYYRYLGSYSKSLSCIQRSVPLVTTIALDPVQGARHFSFAALAFATMGLLDAAAGYQREALRFASATNSDVVKSQNYAFLGTIYGKLKKFDDAQQSVQLALGLAEPHATEPAYRSLFAYSALQMGNVYRDAGEFDKAIAQYSRAIELYKTFPDFEIHLFQAHKGRLQCYIRQQNDPLAQEEVSTLFGLMEKYRTRISDENYRNTFFDVEQSVVNTAIDFEFSRMNNAEQAFYYSNSSRARSLLDRLNADTSMKARVQDADMRFRTVSEPVPLDKIVKLLPERVQLLQYMILEDKLLIWVVSRNDFQVKTQMISRRDLNEKLRRYLNLISRPPAGDEAPETELAKELYAILVQPVEPLLDRGKLLCIIPDGTLSYLPFAALVSPASGKYFLDEHLSMTSPSASVFLTCSENATRNSAAKKEKILSVGNPSFDRAAFPELDDLPAAGREAAEVSGQYSSSVVLAENRATKPAVKSEIEKSDVIHFAIHSTVDDEVPLRSTLLLAKPASSTPKISDSVIYAYEIFNLKLSNTRLVVLSSCDSGTGRYYDGEGVSSFARAFIGAGVPLVVASLWPVDSDATEKLMVSFHKHRAREGATTVEALRSAQADMLRGSAEAYRRPYYWAAFSVTGGDANF
jgi:CHAT domain-containing protein/tetratricopeptide (TPR) repeat protein